MTSQNPGPMEGRTTPSLGAFFLGPHVTAALHAGTPRPTRERNVPQRAHRSLARVSANPKSTHLPRPDSSTTSFPTLRPRTPNVAPLDTRRFPQALTLAVFNFNHFLQNQAPGEQRLGVGHLPLPLLQRQFPHQALQETRAGPSQIARGSPTADAGPPPPAGFQTESRR